MEQFAGYGFNKSHSAAYAFLAFATAYLKAHYRVEFMAARLTSETGNTSKVVRYINECREMGDLSAVNRRMIEALIRAGAMDSLEGGRSQKFAAVEGAMEAGTRAQRD